MWKASVAAILFVTPTAIAVGGFSATLSLENQTLAIDTGRAPTLCVTQDLARGRRWELGWGSASAYDTATGEHVRTIRLIGANQSAAPESGVPDMLLSRTGALIVSSNAQPSLWRISPSNFELERFDIALDSDAGRDFGFTALAWGPDENVLYASSAPLGTRWRIDLISGKARRV